MKNAESIMAAFLDCCLVEKNNLFSKTLACIMFLSESLVFFIKLVIRKKKRIFIFIIVYQQYFYYQEPDFAIAKSGICQPFF